MTRKIIDCRDAPNEIGCTLALTGEPDEVVAAAAEHAVAAHGHTDSAELRERLRDALRDEPTPTAQGAFVQLIEFDTDRPAEWDAIVARWVKAIGAARTTRWSLVAADRERTGRHVAIVEFPNYEQAMRNSAHPATGAFLTELRSISAGEPRFRNLDVLASDTY
jgi:plasmid stability protein